MNQLKQKRRRKRGVILTPIGLQRLQKAKIGLEDDQIGIVSTFSDKLSEISLLDVQTIKKILACKVAVDRRSLECLFDACKLELSEICFCQSNPNRKQDWGEATDVSIFYGRTAELAALEKLVFADRCRFIALLGMGGIGKSSLSIKFAQQTETKFDCVIWKSLRDAPPANEVLTRLIEFLSEGKETEASLPERVGDRITKLIDYLRALRCLIVLDNGESLFDSGSQGKYRQGYEGYGELFRRLGETSHTSCIILTTREKPKEVAVLEGDSYAVRSQSLKGLPKTDGLEIFLAKGLSGSELELNQLRDRYSGNPLALKVVATTIQDLFEGNIAEFLSQERAVFGDIRDVLERQFERLSAIERETMYWLAIAREPVSISQLRENFVSRVTLIKIVEAIDSLSKRSLIEKNASLFTQQPVVMEYVTSRLIEKVGDEIMTDKPWLMRNHALIQATAKDYIRETQIRLILQPIINLLLSNLRGQKYLVEEYLAQIITTQRKNSPREPGYTAGNILNLFCQMETDLTGYDLSNLCVWQADLRQACLHSVNFQNADLAKSVFAETFGGVLSVAFSPDGTLLASGDTNGEIHLRQVSDGKQILTLKGHTNWVMSVAFCPNANILASGSTDHTVRLWDIETGQCLHTLQEHEDEVTSVVFSPDGTLLASGCDDHKIRLWNVTTGQRLRTFQGHTSWVTSVVFSPNGEMLASGCGDSTIRLWNAKTSQCLKTLQGHSNGVRSITFSPNGQVLASGGEDYAVKLWDINNSECLKTFQGHSNGIYSVDFSPKGNLLASGSYDRTVKLWNTSTGECLKTFQGHSSRIWSVAFSPQGNLLASGSHDQTVKLWSINNSQCLRTFQGNTAQLLSVSYSPDGQMLASASQDCKIRLWDVDTGRVLKTFQGHKAAIWSVAFSPDGQTLASASEDRTIMLWDIATSQIIRTFRGHNNQVVSVAFSPDVQMLASGSEDRTLKLWDVVTGQCLITFRGHYDAIWSVVFSPDGKILASGSFDKTVRLWNISTSECIKTLEGHTNWIWSVAFSPDGNLLASVSSDRTLKLWSINTNKCLKTLSNNASALQTVAFSPDSLMIASSSQDYTIELWDVITGKCFSILSGHTSKVWSVAFSPDGKTLASGSEDETIRLWNPITGECLKILKVKKPYEYMNIMDIRGLTKATITTLKALGANNN